MNRNLRKMLRRSIKATFGRYVAILAIVALGVGFFAGLKSSEPAMSGTADEYLKAQNMYDFQLMSSLGITEGDVEAFNALGYVIGAEGAYSLDVLLQRGDKQDAFKFHSITDEVCVPVLVEGRMPENAGECLADALVFKSEDIGTKLKIALGNEEDTVDMLRYGSYTIVGIAKTPRYISGERGSTHLGSGSISGFVLLREDGFDSEAYHELLVQCDINEKSFTDEYNSVRDSMESDIKTFFNERGALRYKELRAEADEEIADARKELDDGWQEYYDGEKEGQKKLEDAAYELYLAQEKIDEGRKEIEKGQQEIDNAKQSLPGTISMLKAQIQSAQTDRENNTKAREELLLEKAQELAPLQAELDAKQAVLDALLADENADDATVEQAQAELAAAQQNLADKTSAFAEKETQR